jgi:hypothetical protein
LYLNLDIGSQKTSHLRQMNLSCAVWTSNINNVYVTLYVCLCFYYIFLSFALYTYFNNTLLSKKKKNTKITLDNKHHFSMNLCYLPWSNSLLDFMPLNSRLVTHGKRKRKLDLLQIRFQYNGNGWIKIISPSFNTCFDFLYFKINLY